MRCPTCNAATVVLANRNGRRRRECFNGHRFTTHEILSTEADFLERQQRLRQARATLHEKGYLR